ncbi:MAG: SMC-Scp complex subunit ScpB [Pseudomonadota bacterium]
MEAQCRMVEAMLFASDKPLSTAELASRMPLGCDAAVAVRRLEEMYAGRGVALARVAGKWAFRTAPDLAHLLTGEAVEQRKLSRAAVETLAIVAYHQPVTRAEIEEIRQVGVSKGTLDLLMELEWIKLGRRRQTPGRPVTFVTTDGFLEHFGLESLKDLPRLEELRQSGLLDATPPSGFSPKLGGAEGSETDLDALSDEDEGLEDDDEDDRARQADFLV